MNSSEEMLSNGKKGQVHLILPLKLHFMRIEEGFFQNKLLFFFSKIASVLEYSTLLVNYNPQNHLQ